MAQLNPEQSAAIRFLDGPLLVLAGAGSGKTRVITHKIVHLLQNCGYQARNIAAITFTNKAAKEMQERVQTQLQGQSARGLTICTFHALGLNLLRREASHLGFKPQFSVLDAADSQGILSDLLGNVDKAMLREAQSQISRWKNAFLSVEAALAQAQDEAQHAQARLYRAYQDTLHAYQAMDFDDLILLPVHLLRQNQEVRERWQHKLRYLLIDEYQDTNACQYELIKLLADQRGMFTAVGDDDQSIYAWRGADIENLRQLGVDYPQLQVIKLEQNYRSTTCILRAANAVIGNNPKLFEKKLWSELGEGDAIQVLACKDEEHEAETVVMRLLAHKFAHRTRYLDYAILYRGNHQARLLEQHLRQQKVPYLMSGGSSFFDKAEIKDLIAYLRLIGNQDDDPAFIRAVTTPKRGVGAQTLEKLGRYAAQRQQSLFAAMFETGFEQQVQSAQLEPLLSFGRLINHIQYRAAKESAGLLVQELLRAIGYEAWLYDGMEPKQAESRWKNVQDFCAWLARRAEEDEKNLFQITQTINLMSMLDGKDEGEVDAVRMSTLHAAKGLEYGHVFLIGVEEDILPHREAVENGQVEEERRLMYVGITRAQRSLTLSYASKRRRGGEVQLTQRSRFLDELPSEGLKWSGLPSGKDQAVSKEEGSAKLAQLRAMLQKPNP